MAKKKDEPSSKVLTPVELELMTALWKRGPCSVHDVLSVLPRERTLAYTSVSTVLRILEQKGFVESRKEGRGHLYAPRLSKVDYEAFSLEQMVTRVFDGTPAALVRRLLETRGLSQDDLKEIQTLLDEKIR